MLGRAVGMLLNAGLNSAEEIMWERPASNGDKGGDDSRCLFAGLSFRIVVTKGENRDKLFSDIESHGGSNIFTGMCIFWANAIN